MQYNHNMNQTISLQVPIDVDLRNRALANAKSLGFSTLQDCIRVFLYQLANDKVDFMFESSSTIKDRIIKQK